MVFAIWLRALWASPISLIFYNGDRRCNRKPAAAAIYRQSTHWAR